jgi:SPP1 family predicted phage head-tail adaptor
LALEGRKFNCRVELYTTSKVADGYGGYTTVENLQGTYFARKQEYKQNPFFAEGQKIGEQYLIFWLRKTPITKDTHLVYKGFKYDIEQVDTTQLETQVKLICRNTGFFISTVILDNIFDNTFDNTFN